MDEWPGLAYITETWLMEVSDVALSDIYLVSINFNTRVSEAISFLFPVRLIHMLLRYIPLCKKCKSSPPPFNLNYKAEQ